MRIHVKTKYLNEDADVEFFTYQHNGRVAIKLNSLIGEPLAIATVNIDGPLKSREIAIKDYFENEGMLAALIAAGIVEDTGVSVASGYVVIPIARLTDAAITEATRQGVL